MMHAIADTTLTVVVIGATVTAFCVLILIVTKKL